VIQTVFTASRVRLGLPPVEPIHAFLAGPYSRGSAESGQPRDRRDNDAAAMWGAAESK
jgi:hypothetical protein